MFMFKDCKELFNLWEEREKLLKYTDPDELVDIVLNIRELQNKYYANKIEVLLTNRLSNL